ncbi:MAG: 4-hydroxybenzoate octaprenyltransferase [Pseudomonadota bacterium]
MSLSQSPTPQQIPPSVDDVVADALARSWVYRLLPRHFWPYAQLARWERPIGWWLLMWPCWWSLALALGFSWTKTIHADADAAKWGITIVLALTAFLLGAVFMRGAGCTYNDIVDTGIDAKVQRTASRPIPSGRVSKQAAVIFLALQAAAGFVCLLVLCLLPVVTGFNLYAFSLALASLTVVFFYPFAKRLTDWPQFVLGLAFSWGALMGWAVLFSALAAPAFWLYVGSIAWVIGYDTIYAHQDREDDALVGVRSTARLFGKRTRPALILLYGFALASFGMACWEAAALWPAYAGLAAGAGHMAWQLHRLDIDDADGCLALFQSNTQFGWIVFAGFAGSALLAGIG